MKLMTIRFIIILNLILTKVLPCCTQEISLDHSFSSDGKVMTDFGTAWDIGTSLKIQSDGKIIVAGFTTIGINRVIAIVRYKPNGDLDREFGDNGIVITSSGKHESWASSMIIQPDNKIVIAGEVWLDSIGNTFLLLRYNTNGTLDNTFGSDGKVFTQLTTDVYSTSGARALVMQNDNKLIVAGYAYNGMSDALALVRYNMNGSIDHTFGMDGKTITSFGGWDETGFDLGLQADGKIIVVGKSDQNLVLSRYTIDGKLDTLFSSDGKVILKNLCSCSYSLAIQEDQKILVVGESSGDIGLFRFNTDGSADSGFGQNGKVTTDMNGSYDRAKAVILQYDGKILVAGESFVDLQSDMAMLRYNQDGSLDSTFNYNGMLTTDFHNETDEANSIEIQKDGKIVLAGYASIAWGSDFAILRYIPSDVIPVRPIITIYPNPTSGKIIITGIDVNQYLHDNDLSLYDSLGRGIYSFTIEGNTIDISPLPSGIYFLKIADQLNIIVKVDY